MENQTQQNKPEGKKEWTAPKLEVLSQKNTLGGTPAFEGEDVYGYSV